MSDSPSGGAAAAIVRPSRYDAHALTAPRAFVLWGILVVAVLLMATSSPLVLQAGAVGMGALTIAFWRMLLGTMLQAPLALLPGEGGNGAARATAHQEGAHGKGGTARAGGLAGFLHDRGAIGATLLAGALLGLHFAFFIGSLSQTTVASATTLTATVPVFTALLGRLVLGDRVPRAFWPSVAIAFAGVVLMTSDQWGVGTATRTGNLLAFSAALTAAGYLVAGRRARAALGVGIYVTAIYGIAAAILAVALVLRGGIPLPPWPWGWFWCGALAVFPTTLGHSLLSWSLRWITPAIVSLLALAEPPLALILCWAWLGQPVTFVALGGMTMTLTGISILVVSGNNARRRRRAAIMAPPLEEPPLTG
jgi:drug/metabolite transporter (DMT)-like permease